MCNSTKSSPCIPYPNSPIVNFLPHLHSFHSLSYLHTHIPPELWGGSCRHPVCTLIAKYSPVLGERALGPRPPDQGTVQGRRTVAARPQLRCCLLRVMAAVVSPRSGSLVFRVGQLLRLLGPLCVRRPALVGKCPLMGLVDGFVSDAGHAVWRGCHQSDHVSSSGAT